ncbi:transporter [Noviherbaspirillum denitrificans]|uniref:Transporter n=1 Tax=Noviherbaspirillum denitrificans TaxID=1968433 RepID=A0A254TAY3_9BURK|nr:transporter [Noviherbaspirillum denitrificans]OWW19809.1 hypothetical protein AYR66_10150 [Noviherbaspirillum denitrificans]
MKPFAICCSLVFLAAGTAHAAHPLVTDDTGTQGRGNHQLELNTDRMRDAGVSSQSAAITYTYGLRDALDAFVTLPAATTSPSGLGDVAAGFKWRFSESAGTTFGLKPELFFATGNENRGLGSGRAHAGLTLLASHQAGEWTLLGNAGLAVNRYALPVDHDQNRRYVWRLSAAAIREVAEGWKALVDSGVARNTARSERTHPAFILLGMIYSPSEKLDLDIGWKAGLNSAETHRQVGAGVTVRF